MKAPNNFIFVSSLNARLYKHRDNTFTRYVPQSFLNNKCILYHENSFDQSNNNESIDLDEMKDLINLELIDLFEDSPWLESFLKESPFKDCYKSHNYYMNSSPFWFRKVVAISRAIEKLEIGDVMVWADCDSYVTQEFTDNFYEYQKKHDWLVILRSNDWIESGFQFININETTKEFGKFYLNYFLSGEVFDKEPEWADNWVLEACFKNFNKEMRVGGLNSSFGCPINIMDYISHAKDPLKEVRFKFKI